MMSEKKEYIFSDLFAYVEEKDNISEKFEENKWRKMEYKTAKCAGNMLITAQDVYPEKITLDLKLTGVYQIYICVPKMRSENYTYIKLTDDICYTGLRPSKYRPHHWCECEYLEEVFWKTADLSGQKLIIEKPEAWFLSVSGVAWIRCVPAELEEKIEKRCVLAHMDEDQFGEDVFQTKDDYLIRLNRAKDTNVEVCSVEVSFDYDRVSDNNELPMLHHDERWKNGDYHFETVKETIYPHYINFAHENQMKIYATNRMEVGNFTTPYSHPSWNKNFVMKHPQFYCRNRDNSIVNVCSYAYPEVQDYVIENLLQILAFGFDGLSLIFHRGMHIGFDKPVIDRFSELYPDINPYLLPLRDDRLAGVMCEFMSQFMEKLRKATNEKFDRHIDINVFTYYGVEMGKPFGIDVEDWAKKGLVDSVCQTDMEVFENLEGCMYDDNPDLIDLEKYQIQLGQRPIIDRECSEGIKKLFRYAEEFAEIQRKYGVTVYGCLPWEHTILPEEYEGYAKQLKSIGIEKIFCWNMNQRVWNLPEWYAISHIGSKWEDGIVLRKFHRVLSLDGSDMSHFNPNWRG